MCSSALAPCTDALFYIHRNGAEATPADRTGQDSTAVTLLDQCHSFLVRQVCSNGTGLPGSSAG